MKNLKKSISVKWKILGSLIFFVVVIILVLWLFQVFFLEKFYMYTKSNAVKKAASNINEIIHQSDSESTIEKIAKDNDFCVEVYRNDDFSSTNVKPIYSTNTGDHRCKIGGLNTLQYQNIVVSLEEKVKKDGGSSSKLIEQGIDELLKKPSLPILNEFNNSKLPNIDNNKNKTNSIKNMMYVSVVKVGDNELKTIVINAQLTPVNATIDTIKTQFSIIAIILILVALLLAFYLSKKIATPIININKSAKALAKGEYQVHFEGREYLEIKELNDTLNYASKELSKVESLRRELIANMSHDLRTPLTMISGYGEVMRDIPKENTPENVQIIIDETRRLTTLVNDMLDLSKLQAGVQTLQNADFNITQEIKMMIERYGKMLGDQQCEIVFEYEEEVIVHGDAIKLGQVIYNLINNAINYCGDDRKVIVQQQVSKGYLKLGFIDHGEGIEKDKLPYIWERYYKVDKTHVRSKVGTGLGLSIVKTILDLHKANYGVDSEMNIGSTFWFELPIKTLR